MIGLERKYNTEEPGALPFDTKYILFDINQVWYIFTRKFPVLHLCSKPLIYYMYYTV